MKIKQAYTQMHLYLPKQLKTYGKTWEQYEQMLGEEAKAGIQKDGKVPGTLIGVWVAFSIEERIATGRALHIFLPDAQFCEWLVGCVGKVESEHVLALQEEIGKDCCGVLHFPTASKRHSLGFHAGHAIDIDMSAIKLRPSTRDARMRMLFCHASQDNPRIGQFGFLFGDDKNPPVSPSEEEALWYCKLLAGLGMYLNCFPECVHKGPPIDLKHPAHHQGQTQQVSVAISDKIRVVHSGTHESPIAHYRCGHFRLLKHERYTHKRFQSVFVRETFVKGRAETVLSPEEVTP